jgi:hypothetical protein
MKNPATVADMIGRNRGSGANCQPGRAARSHVRFNNSSSAIASRSPRVPAQGRRDDSRHYAREAVTTAGIRLHASEYRVYLALGKAWAPYGGPPDEDIFITFGVVPDVYFERLLEIVNHHEEAFWIRPELRTRIAQTCTARLGSPTPHAS